jgi:hypothetical protein
MYDFQNRRDRDEVAISRESRISFARTLFMVSALSLLFWVFL